MADVVQFRLERMVDELEDLERRGLFTHDEIMEIVRRRRDFEYRLKRPRPLKHDFLAYVDYEVQLNALRVLRKKKILGELKRQLRRSDEVGKDKKKGEKLWKRSISDVAGIVRILEIYRLAVVRYKGDLDLWFRYLEFCREHRHGRMKQALAQAIRFHPKIPGLWIYAASWEFDQNLNVAAARALMQNGLRECPTSEDIWIEYLRMELTYLNKLKARKVALGEDVKTLEKDKRENESNKWKEENQELFMSLDQADAAEESGVQQGALKASENFFWAQGSVILQTVYHGAIEAIPSSINLRKQFLEILDNVDLAHSNELKGEIMADIKKLFSSQEEYWDWVAKLEVSEVLNGKDLTKEDALHRLEKAIQVYEEAVHFVPSPKMFSLYAKFLSDIVFSEIDERSSVFQKLGIDASQFASNLLGVYEKAESYGSINSDIACDYVSYFLQVGSLDEARELAERLCHNDNLKDSKLWSLRISMEIKWLTCRPTSTSKDEFDHIFQLLNYVVDKVAFSETEVLWQMVIKFFSNRKVHFEKLVKIIMFQVAKAAGDQCGFFISSTIVNCILQRDGLKHARDMYRRFLALPRPSLAFFKYCIELESNILSSGDAKALANVRNIYDSALSIYGQSDELWRDYYCFETKMGTSETANAVYWRARKANKDVTILTSATTL